MKTEEEIKERIEWCKDCYKAAEKYKIYSYDYKIVAETLEWVLED